MHSGSTQHCLSHRIAICFICSIGLVFCSLSHLSFCSIFIYLISFSPLPHLSAKAKKFWLYWIFEVLFRPRSKCLSSLKTDFKFRLHFSPISRNNTFQVIEPFSLLLRLLSLYLVQGRSYFRSTVLHQSHPCFNCTFSTTNEHDRTITDLLHQTWSKHTGRLSNKMESRL